MNFRLVRGLFPKPQTPNPKPHPPFPAALLICCALALPALLLPALCRAADDCANCHDRQERKGAVVKLPVESAHAKTLCSECHKGVTTDPKAEKVHGASIAPVQCAPCHLAAAGVVSASSHDRKMTASADEKDRAFPSVHCAGCHGADSHVMLKVKSPDSPANRMKSARMCFSCHEEDMKEHGDYFTGVHARAQKGDQAPAAVCADCHDFHRLSGPGFPASKVARLNIAQACGRCHKKQYEKYAIGAHGTAVVKGVKDAPVCTDCHGEHAILPRTDPQSPAAGANITKTCSACHANAETMAKAGLPADHVQRFQGSFHGLAAAWGDTHAPNCASCHRAHGNMPEKDTRSPLHPGHLAETCGKCHAGARPNLDGARMHETPQQPLHWLAQAARWGYLGLIGLLAVAMPLHNLLDFRWKRRGLRAAALPLGASCSRSERIQHGVLALSFLALALSGFALQWPHSFAAWPFRQFSDAALARSWTHRIAAALFAGMLVCHVLWLLLTARGWEYFSARRPRGSDLSLLRERLGAYWSRRALSVPWPRCSYIEKAEYAAFLWGALVMLATGATLLFVSISLTRLPFWCVQLAGTIHFYEALLAVVALTLWHGYWGVVDPWLQRRQRRK